MQLTPIPVPAWQVPAPRRHNAPTLSYYSFAAAWAHGGKAHALRCAVIYGVPLETCLRYVRMYSVIGYVV